MGSYVDKLQKKAGEFLQPGETLAGAIRTQPRGSTVGTAVGGLVGAAVAKRQASKAAGEAGEGSVAAAWPKGNAAVGLTNRRLLFFNYTAMGKPKDLVGEIPLEQVMTVEQGQKKIMHNVRFGFTDGSGVEVECAKMEKVGDFVSAFQRVKSGT